MIYVHVLFTRGGGWLFAKLVRSSWHLHVHVAGMPLDRNISYPFSELLTHTLGRISNLGSSGRSTLATHSVDGLVFVTMAAFHECVYMKPRP